MEYNYILLFYIVTFIYILVESIEKGGLGKLTIEIYMYLAYLKITQHNNHDSAPVKYFHAIQKHIYKRFYFLEQKFNMVFFFKCRNNKETKQCILTW